MDKYVAVTDVDTQGFPLIDKVRKSISNFALESSQDPGKSILLLTLFFLNFSKLVLLRGKGLKFTQEA